MYYHDDNGTHRTAPYQKWINKFPKVMWGIEDIRAEYEIFIEYTCLEKFDVDNLTKSLLDEIQRQTTIDDKLFTKIHAKRVATVEKYEDGKISFCIRQTTFPE